MTSGSSLEGRTMLITGASDGIGKETASVLAGRGARVILHGRNADRCEVARRGILKSHPDATVDIEVADFSSLDQVRGLARRVNRAYPELHVLINNAGVYMTRRVVTTDGLETTFAVNHLAHFVLTLLLLDLLRRSAPARIITVSSIAHTRGIIDPANLQGEKTFDAYNAYAMSKLANVLFTMELASRLNGSGVTANCLHPGVIQTKLLSDGFPSLDGGSTADGAATPVHLAVSPDVAGTTGKYFVNRKEQRPSGDSTSPRLRKELWKISEQLSGTLLP